MSLSSHIKAQIAQAQTDAERVFNDNPSVDFDRTKINYGRDLEVNISSPADVVSIDITSKRPVEGPKIGQETLKSGSSVHAATSPQSWGKPNRG